MSPRGDDGEGQTPPADLDAERACISAVLLSPPVVAVLDFLQPPHFYSEAHRQIWRVIRDLVDANVPLDVQTVASRLNDAKRLEQAGGMGYLAGILDAAPVVQTSNVRAYGVAVYERWRVREAMGVAQRTAAQGYAGVVAVQAYVDEAIGKLVAISRANPDSGAETTAQMLTRIGQQMVAASQLTAEQAAGKTLGLQTGIRELDLKTGGIRPREKVTVMAQRGRGKTTFAMQVAMHMAGFRGLDRQLAQDRVAVRMFTSEMTRDELGDKMLAYATRIDSNRVAAARIKPTLSADEWQRMDLALALLPRLRFSIDDRAHLTAEDVVSTVKQEVERARAADGLPLGLVVVDYLQRLAVPKHMQGGRFSEEQIYAHGSAALKNLALETGVAVLELAQMNAPDPKVSPTGKPYEGLASGCKRIEKESNRVWCIWRPKRDVKTDLRLTSTKERSGDEFDIALGFEPEYGRFYDPEWENYQSAFDGL